MCLPKKETADLLTLKTETCTTPTEQIQTKTQETPEFEPTQPKHTFSFTLPNNSVP